jgi:hypothetical protein
MLWAEMTALIQGLSAERIPLVELKQYVSDAPSLVAVIDERLKPRRDDAELQRMEAKHAAHVRKEETRAAKAHASWVAFWQDIVNEPDKVFHPDRAQNTAWNLWNAMERSGEESRASGWNRRFIETQFGKEIADRLRSAMKTAWRNDKPTLRSERPESEKGRFLVRWQLGLAAIAAEAEDPNWTKTLTEAEAELACRYAPMELNGFPSWMDGLASAYPAAVDRVLGAELTASLNELGEAHTHSMFLQNVRYASPAVAQLFVPRVRTWLSEVSADERQSNHPASEHNLNQAIEILLKYGNEEDRRFLESTALRRLSSGLAAPQATVWLPVLFQLNPAAAVDILENGLAASPVSSVGDGAQWLARLLGRHQSAINLAEPGFTPKLLLRLVRLAYAHVRIGDDVRHEGVHEIGTRDHAEEARNTVLSALLATTGIEGWNAKLDLAHDPLLAHFKDRAIALAQEKSAEEADGVALTEGEFAVLDAYGETPPSTRDAMFSLMRDRLDDIDDLLLQDVSPREAWAGITEERVMRRELARELRNLANHVYTVDQEAATADEKETDIRLRATASGQQGTIELKIGEKKRSAAELKAALKDQLLTKYMAADECRAGCLVVTVASDRHWNDPDTDRRLDLHGLVALLDEEAQRLSKDLGGAVKLMAKGLDLRPRLTTEGKARTRVSGSP